MADGNGIKYNKGNKERFISFVVLILLFITIWYMKNIVLLTFIITFIFYHLVAGIQRKLRYIFPFKIPDGAVLTMLYTLFILVLIFGSIELAPKLALQFTEIADIFIKFDINSVKEVIDPRIGEAISNIDFNKYIGEAGKMLASGVTAIGGFGVNLFLALILSFLILLEKDKIRRFGGRLATSRISYIYDYLITFGGNFVVTFGKVMKVQVLIATINSIVSMLLLTFLGFPQIMSLGVMIFLLGLIPVAGMIISLIPLSIVAFNIGGLSKVVAVILMIIFIHAMEAYILNPKLMSEKTELPVCFVFIILLVGEHYLGVWGLLIGVPIFIFLLNALEVDYVGVCKVKKPKKQERSRDKRDKLKI